MSNRSLAVIVFAYGDSKALETTLQNLRQQSLSRADFDVYVLSNTPGIDQEDTSNQGGELSHISLDEPNHRENLTGSHGRSLDTRLSEYVTFISEGDFLSPHYLEAMLNAVEEDFVPVSLMIEALSEDERFSQNAINEHLLTKGNYALAPYECPVEFLQEPAGKLFRTETLVNHHLGSLLRGDWLYVQVSMALTYDFKFSKFPAAVGATYYRSQPSDETQEPLDHSVDDAIQKLQALQVFRRQELTEIQDALLSSVEAHLMTQVRDLWDPAENRSAFQTIADLSLRGLPWDVLNEPVDTVAIVTNFAPHAGTAGIVAGKRIIKRGKRVDLISSVVSSRKRYTKDLLLTEPYLRSHKVHSPRIRGDNDVDFRHFLDDALHTLELWQEHGAEYRNIYSRSMMPHSHIVAAAVKRRYPTWHWIAEFSDPNSVDAQGKKRLASFRDPSIFPEFQNWGTPEQQELLFSDLRLYRWAELLPYFHADRILFTNEHQKEFMLDSAPAGYRESIREKSIVEHHPTLPPGYYQLSDPDLVETDGEILLGYFGNFYDTRGLTEIIEALNQLDDVELRRFKLVIYTGSREERIHAGFPQRVRQIMTIKPRLDYLKSLATMNSMDYLIVNDADTKDYFPRNPFLPSKVSDYIGSEARVWAIVEAGSVLSKLKFGLESALGDIEGALRVLREILKNHDTCGASRST